MVTDARYCAECGLEIDQAVDREFGGLCGFCYDNRLSQQMFSPDHEPPYHDDSGQQAEEAYYYFKWQEGRSE